MSTRSASTYLSTLRALVADGWLQTDDHVLVVAGSEVDHEALLEAGLQDVTISNLDERMDGSKYRPFGWSRQDAEHLGFDDNSFDVCIVHHGLHHCRSPHQALLEMYRVAQRGMVVFEPLDNTLTRLGVRLGIGQEFECAAVAHNGLRHGGVRNSPIPNFVYRWTLRELRKTLAACDPIGDANVKCHYELAPASRWYSGGKFTRSALRLAPRLFGFANRVMPVVATRAAFVVDKVDPDVDLHPWLTASSSGPAPSTVWFNEKFGQQCEHS